MSDDFDPVAFARHAQERQAARRMDPMAFLETALTELWEGGREDDMVSRWRSRASTDPWYAADLIHAIGVAVEDPPMDLIARLNRAGVRLFHYGPTAVTPYTHDEVVAWIADQGEKLRAISDEVVGS